MRSRPARRTLLAVLVLAVLAFVVYGELLRPGCLPDSPYSDIVPYHLAAQTVLHRSVAQGHGIPFWRADQLSGSPAFTNPNSLYTNPLHGLFYLVPPVAAMGPTLWLHVLACGLAYLLAARVLGLGWGASLFVGSAGLLQFKLLMAVYTGWLSVLPSLVTLPLLAAATFRLVRSPSLAGGLALAGAAAFGLHAGHLQLVFYAAWFVCVFLLVAMISAWRREERRVAGRLCLWATAAAILALGLSAYILLPMAAEAPLVSRATVDEAFLRRGHSLGLAHLLTLLHPEMLGSPLDGTYPGAEFWEDVAYFGVLPLVLAVIGAILGRRRWPTTALSVGLVAAVLLSLDTPLVEMLYGVLPGYRFFRLPGRMLFLASLFGILLAGIGLEEGGARLARRGAPRWLPAFLVIGLVAASGAEATWYARAYLHTVTAESLMPRPKVVRAAIEDRGAFRIATLGRGAFTYGWAEPLGLRLVNGYEPYNLQRYAEYMQLLQWDSVRYRGPVVSTHLDDIVRWDLLDSLNVRYLVAPVGVQLPIDRFEPLGVFQGESVFVPYHGMRRIDLALHRNRAAHARAYWVDTVSIASDREQAVSLVRQTTLLGRAVVEGRSAALAGGGASPRDDVRVLGERNGYLALYTQAEANRFLVISEIWHPGWQATLDGVPVALGPANVALMGLWVPAGEHRVVLTFRPLLWRPGLGITAGSLVAFLGGLAICIRSRGSRRDRRCAHGVASA
jgi:hypothetical protein